MTTTNSSTANFSQTVVALVEKRLEELLRAPLPHLLPGNFRKAEFVKGTNNTMRFINIPDLSVTTNSGVISAGTQPWLTEGTPPTAEGLTIQYEEFVAGQAGRLLTLTDIAMERSPFDLLMEGADRVARNSIITADQYVSDIIKAGTNVLYAGTGNAATADLAAGDVISALNIKRAVAKLAGTNVPRFGEGKYHAIIHPYAVLDVESDTDVGGWIDAARYAGAMPLLTGELGTYAGVRFVESSQAGVKAAGAGDASDVYSTVFFGPEAYAFGDWGTIQTFFTAPGGQGDELHQKASVGWKGNFGAKLITAAGNRYIRYESTSSI